ncbi:MAG: winged helix-turn-helix transcriptional regulator [Ignavibacteriae bacterium]|nr:winged helix-turn-helix transcriptional regulator [Ignavibacteriota bacterium]
MKTPISGTLLFHLHAEMCKTLSNHKRLEILSLFRDTELNVSEIVRKMLIPKANVSQHLSMMRKAGILETRRDGLNIYYRISNPKVMKAYDLICEVLVEHHQKVNTIMSGAKGERNQHAI